MTMPYLRTSSLVGSVATASEESTTCVSYFFTAPTDEQSFALTDLLFAFIAFHGCCLLLLLLLFVQLM